MINQGRTIYPIHLGDEPSIYNIEINDEYAEFLTLLVIQPLYLNSWENLTLDYSVDDCGGDPSGPDNKITDVDSTKDIFTRTFYGYGEVALCLCAPLLSYNSFYIEIDGYLVQSLKLLESFALKEGIP